MNTIIKGNAKDQKLPLNCALELMAFIKLSNILSFTGKLRPRENQLVFRLEETIESRKKNLSIPLKDFLQWMLNCRTVITYHC